jgi:hypothetical protein
MLACPHCQSTTTSRKDGLINGEQRYLCRACGRKYTASTYRLTPVTHQEETGLCLFCGQKTKNPKFCSTSCAAKHNNSLFHKRKQKTRYCKHCGIVIRAGRTVCDNCNPSLVDWSQRTLKSLQDSAKYQVSAKVRDIARYNYDKANLPRVCANCGYAKHVEICHVKAINSFSDETPVAVINDLTNLVALCPNCHWEFDNGLLLL